ncbi:MAG: biopolymer transporter ExbD [Planctomycetes bacterium]|nr:biopolymer transporter ExbD [Planctomycetota bacterium]
MSAWFVRQQGSPAAVSVPSPGSVAEGLRDGNWLPTDEVKGPTDAKWRSIESHPVFAEIAEDMEPIRPPAASDDHLDMNPLIDVCLVLLIFFILTITYASLERAIDVPPVNPEDKGPSLNLREKDVRDKVFIVTAKMDGERAVVKIEQKEVTQDQIFNEMKSVINSTGRKEMVLDADKDVPWGVVTAILDAAKGNGVHNIIKNRRK